MGVQWHPAALPLALNVVVDAILMVVIWRRRRTTPAAPVLLLLVVAVDIWLIADLLSRVTVTLGTMLFWQHAIYAGVVLTPGAFLAFALNLTGRGHLLTRRVLLLLAIEPVLTLVAVATDPWHHLFLAAPRLVDEGGPVELYWERGPLFWAHALYSYAVLTAAMVLLVTGLGRAARPYRRQLRTVLVGALAPTVANVATQFGVIDVGNLDLTPMAFTVTGVFFTWALFRQQLLDLVPVARDMVIDTIGDAVVVVDVHGRLADLNPAAVALLNRAGTRAGPPSLGQPAEEVFTGWDGVLPLDRDLVREVDVGAGTGVVDVRGTVLRDRLGRDAGHLLVLRDVTQRRTAERALAAVNKALRDQVTTIDRLRVELREQAIRDALTGLYNRRYLDEVLAAELSRASHEGYPLSVALLDVDRFKRINDTYGHAAGDRMLAAIGALLGRSVRKGDVACRYGGEEFLVILPNAGQQDALARAEEWRTGCAALRVDDDDSTDRTVGVTVSIGVATAPQDGAEPAAVLAAADRALYAAKRGGRDRVVAARPRSSAVL
jgi:diguanylate cyclase (GGDEF)-like protein